jgi:YidC/Oxa1 family membrane protein insertase
MEKRVLLAVVLSLAVLLMYQAYFAPPPPKTPVKREVQSVDIPSSLVAEDQKPIETSPLIIEPETADNQIDKDLLESMVEPDEKTIQVSTRDYTAMLSNRGAHITGWELNAYSNGEGKPLQFVTEAKGRYFPGDVKVGDTDRFSTRVFKTDAPSDQIVLDRQTPAITLTFQTTDTSGLQLVKRYTLHHDSILMDLDIQLINRGHKDAGGTASVFLPDKILKDLDEKAKNRFARSGPTLMIGNKLEQPKLKKLPGLWVYPQPVQWVATEENFFFAGLVPVELSGKGFVQPMVFNENNGKAERASPGFQFGSGSLAPGEHRRATYYLLLGPKKYDLLKTLNIGIENIVNFGWITWLGKLFYSILVETTKVVKNYGLSIIILTIAIKILLLPLSHMSMKSMKKMQEIQPQMKEIQQRFKKDPRKQQEELSKLYKKHGANPMSGCLPMLVQFPVFIALYQVLLNSIEMRGASFLWAGDLSQPDVPLVLIMGASMLIQQKMTPTTGDPRQAKMMMFMPVIFTAMFWTFPSGLVLYWLMNNLLTILQQYIMNASSDDSSDEEQMKVKARTLKKLEGKTRALETDSDRD